MRWLSWPLWQMEASGAMPLPSTAAPRPDMAEGLARSPRPLAMAPVGKPVVVDDSLLRIAIGTNIWSWASLCQVPGQLATCR